MITGTNVAARLSPNEPSGSSVSPTSSVIGMNIVSSSCSPLRSSSFSSRPNCAASILGTACGPRIGRERAAAETALRAHDRNSRPVSSRNTSSRLRCSTRMSVASTSICAHHAVTVASTCGSIGALDQVLARRRLGGLVVLRQRRHQQRQIESRRRAEPQLVLGAAAHQLGGRAGGHRHPVVDDHQPVGELLGLLELVGGQHHRHAVAAQRVDQLPHQDPGVGVHARGGLVEEHQFGPADQRARQREPLLLAAGEPSVGGAGRVGQAQRVQQPLRVQRVGGVGGHQVEHLAGPRRGVAAAALQHHADARPQPRVVGDRVQPEHLDGAGVGADEALAHLDGRGLAGAVGAEQRQHLGGVHVEVEAGDGGGRRAVLLAHPAQPHAGCRRPQSSSRGFSVGVRVAARPAGSWPWAAPDRVVAAVGVRAPRPSSRRHGRRCRSAR